MSNKFAIIALAIFSAALVGFCIGLHAGRHSYPDCKQPSTYGKSPACIYYFQDERKTHSDSDIIDPRLDVKTYEY